MDAQVNFKAQEQAVEGFVNALQELKAMMKSINDLPITRLRGVEKSLVTPMQEAVGKLAEAGTAMVGQFKQIGQKSGEALEAGAKTSIAKATTQVKQALAGHYDALGNFVSTASEELKAKTVKAAAAALMLDTNVVRQATQQATQAMSGHYNALGVYVDSRSKELQAKAEANQVALARVYSKLGAMATGDTGVRLHQGAQGSLDELRDYYRRVQQTAEIRERVLSRLGQQTSPDTGIRLHAGAQGDLTAMKSHYSELERVANLKAQIKKRIETSDVAFKPTPSPRMSLDQRDAQYNEAMSAMRAHYSPTASVPRAPMSESAQATLRAAAALRDKAKASAEMTGAAAKSSGPLKVLTNHLTDMHSAARGVASGFGMMWLTWGKLTPLLAGAALSNSLVQTAHKGKEFETVLAGIEFMGGESAAGVAKLSAAAVSLGASTQYGPLEVAKGLKTLTLAGLDAEQSLAAIRPMLNFATVSELPLDQAATSLMGISKAFGYSASEVSVAGDVVAKAAAVSMTSVADMTEAFKQSSTVAQQFGVTIQDQAVGLAQLAEIGIKGSAAGTAQRNMYVELMGSSKKARQVLQETLKVDVFDNATKAMKPLPVIMKELALSLSKFDAKSQQSILHVIGNERGMKMTSAGLVDISKAAAAAGVPLKDYVANMSDMQRKLAEAPGFMAVAAAGMSATTENIMKSVGGTLQGSMIKAFEEMSPYLINFSQSLKAVFASPEFIQGLKDTIKFVGDAAQAFASAVKLAWEYRDGIMAVGAGLLALKASATVIGVLTTGWAALAGAVRTVALTFAIAGPAAGAAAVGTTALSAAMVALRAAMGPIGLALTAAASAYYYFSGAAQSETEKAAAATKAANDEMRKSLEAKRDIMVSSIDTEIGRLQLYIKHKGDEKKIAEEVGRSKEKEAADAADSTIVKLLAMASEAAGVATIEAATKRLLAAELERDDTFGGSHASRITQLKEEAGALDVQARNIRAKGEFEANVFRQKVAFQAALAKQAAGIANTKAGNRPGNYGTDTFNPDDKSKSNKGKDFSFKHDNELQQIEKRYADEIATIKEFERNEQNLLKARHDNKLVSDGQFYAQELLLAQKAESEQLALAARSKDQYTASFQKQVDDLESAYDAYLTGIKGKDNFAELKSQATEKFELELKNTGNAFATFWQKVSNDEKSVSDGALTRITLQSYKAQGAIKALDLATEEFWRKEAQARKKAASADQTEDLLRYASPEASAYISAAASEVERLTDILDEQDKVIKLKAESVQAADDAAWLEAGVNKELNDSLATQTEELKKLRAARDQLAGRVGDMSDAAGTRALTRFRKDEEAQLIKGIADAVTTGLFEGGQAGKKKLRDLVVAELRKPITLVVQAVVQAGVSSILGGGSQGGSAITNGLNAFSAGKTAYSAFTSLAASGGAAAGTLAASNVVGAMGGDAIGSLIATNAAQWGVAATEVGTASAAAAGSLSSLGSAVAAIPGWGWALAGVAALATMLDDSGTMHSGGAAQWSAASGLKTSNEVNPFGLNVAKTDFSQTGASVAQGIASGLGQSLDRLAVTFGQKAGYNVAAAFADDTSKDGAWGALTIKNASGQAMVDWTASQTSKWAPREFADGEAGLKAYTAAVAADVTAMIKAMALPEWAKRFADELPAAATLDQLKAAMAQIADYPNTLLQQAGTTRDALVQTFADGLMAGDATAAGQAVADQLVASIESTMVGNASAQIFDIVNRGIVTPMLDAMLTGQSVTQALSQASLDAVVAKATATAQALGAVLNDPTFAAAMAAIRTSVGSALGTASGALAYTPQYQVAAPVQTADAAQQLAEKYQQITDKLNDDGLSAKIDLYRALGMEEEALYLERQVAIKGMDEYRQGLYDQNQYYKLQLKLITEKNDLDAQMAELMGDTNFARNKELAALEPGNRALQQRIWALQDEREALDAFYSAADSAAESLLSSADLIQYKYARQAQALSKVGVGTGDVLADAATLATLTPQQLRSMATAFVQTYGEANKATPAVLEVADALIQLANAANPIVEAFSGASDKLLQGGALSTFKVYSAVIDALNSSGLSADNAAILTNMVGAMSSDELRQAAFAFLSVEDNSVEAKAAVIKLADTLITMRDAAIEAKKSAEEQVRSTYKAITDALKAEEDKIIAGFVGAQTAIIDGFVEAQTNVNNLIKESATTLRTFADTIEEFIDSIDNSDLSGKDKLTQYAQAQSQLAILKAQALAGDEKAQAKITDAAQRVLDLGRGNSATAVDYRRIVAQVKNSLQEVADAVNAKADEIDPVVVALTPIEAAQKKLVEWQELAHKYDISDETIQNKLSSTQDKLLAADVAMEQWTRLTKDAVISSERIAQAQLTAVQNARTDWLKASELKIEADRIIAANNLTGVITAITENPQVKALSDAVTTYQGAVAALSISVANLGMATGGVATSLISTLLPLVKAIDNLAAAIAGMKLTTGGLQVPVTPTGPITGPTTGPSAPTNPVSPTDRYGAPAVDSMVGFIQSVAASATPEAYAAGVTNIIASAQAQGIASADLSNILAQAGYSGVGQSEINDWAAANGLPRFAGGGFHKGGLRLVGENGPELEATGAARIWTAGQTRNMLSGGGDNDDEVIEVLEEVRDLLVSIGYETKAITGHTNRTARILTRVTQDGEAITTTPLV